MTRTLARPPACGIGEIPDRARYRGRRRMPGRTPYEHLTAWSEAGDARPAAIETGSSLCGRREPWAAAAR
jgi:hypothetical protein